MSSEKNHTSKKGKEPAITHDHDGTVIGNHQELAVLPKEFHDSILVFADDMDSACNKFADHVEKISR